MRSELVPFLEAFSLWLAFLLLLPKRGWRSLLPRFRQVTAGRRRWIFEPPSAPRSPVESLISHLFRVLELGVPVVVAALAAERRSAQLGRLADHRWRESSSAVLLDVAQGRIDEPEARRMLEARGLPPAPDKALPPSTRPRRAMSVEWFVERESPAPAGTGPNGNGSTPNPVDRPRDGSLLEVATLGGFALRDGTGDLTSALLRSRVLSFIWLHLLTRAIANPKERVSRAQLADELTPGLAVDKQRKRLRDRLSDLSGELPPGLSKPISLEDDLVRFDISRCSVDLIRLLELADECDGREGMLSDHLAREVEQALAASGGEFLPNWDELEREVTGGRGTAGNVVRDLRTRAEAARVGLLGALSLNHLARRQPSRAIPLLEQALEKQPEREDLARSLRAAYLESGQPNRARSLQHEYGLE